MPAESVLKSMYACTAEDVAFTSVLERVGLPSSDEALADLIEQDGRHRMHAGRIVELQRYLHGVPDLERRPVALDAAIDMALQSLSGTSRPSRASVESLSRSYPRLAEAIREAGVLGEAMMSTTGLRRRVDGPSRIQLPCDFGPRLGSGVCRYALTRLLGAGGWGEVYLGTDRQLSEQGHEALVAVKVLAAADQGAWARQRFIEEATKARRVNHANVVRVLDRGVSEHGENFIVYEHIEGGDLGNWIQRRSSRLPARDAASLVARISRGVQAAHSAGLVHCDLKPANILMTADGEPKVADFGIAVRTGESVAQASGTVSGRFAGNMAFVSPEQYRMEAGCMSIPSDVYSLGGVLYYLLTGELPNGTSADEIAATHDPRTGRTTPPSVRARRPELDRDIDAICRRALAPRQEDRYSSGAALAEDLEAWLARQPIRWNNPTGVRLLRLWAVRNPAWLAGLSLAFVSVTAGAAATLHWSSVAAKKELQTRDAQAAMISSRAGLGELLRKVGRMRKDKAGEDILPVLVGMEWLEGRRLLGGDEESVKLWHERIGVFRDITGENNGGGHGEDLEELLWEGNLGYWLLGDQKPEEAERVLAGLVAKLEKTLRPQDPYIQQMRTLLAAATVERVRAGSSMSGLRPEELIELHAAETVLQNEAAAFQWHCSKSPMRQRVLATVLNLYGPKMLDQPDQLKRAKKHLKDAGG